MHDAKLSAGAPGILVITWNYPPRQGGMEQLLASVCGGLSQLRRVSVITAHADQNYAAGNETVLRPAAPGLVRFFLFAFAKGAALLRGDRTVQVVFGGSVLVTPIVLLLARWFGRRAVLQAHGLDLIYRSWIYQLCVVRWLRYTDRVIANSRHTAQLAERKGVPPDVIAVIPPGVDCQRFEVVENAEALKQARGLAGRKIILFVGRLARRKGVGEFIERSLIHLVKQLPEVCFVIAGANPGESLTHRDDVAGAIRQSIERHELASHVRLLGAVSDAELAALYALCDVLVLPVLDLDSDVEGFGMVALEAAAAGKPVVATRCGGIPDAIEDGQSGILVEPGNYPALTAALVSLLTDSTMAKAMGERGRRRASEEFSWARIVARYDAALGD